MNYDKYHLSARECMICIGEYIIIISLISYLFYDSMLFIIFFVPLTPLYVKKEAARRKINRKERLGEEFLKSLQSVATSLAAGISPENAFKEAYIEMERMYGPGELIVLELKELCQKLSYGTRLEEALQDFASRSGISAISDFALVFETAKETGGSFQRVISNCVNIMEEDYRIKGEIKVLIRSRQYEQRIMSVIPLGIILYLKLSSRGFLDVLYHNFFGYLVMTGCLAAYIISVIVSEKICEISL